jgi:hypothetical protein
VASFCTRERTPIQQQEIEKQSKEIEKLIDIGSDTFGSQASDQQVG